MPTTVEQLFHAHVTRWKKDTLHVSSSTVQQEHKSYKAIVRIARRNRKVVLPLLFEELSTQPDWWFAALKAITEVDPSSPKDKGDLRKLTPIWLAWWEQEKHKYLEESNP